MLTTTAALASTMGSCFSRYRRDSMAFNGRRTGVRGHTRFVGKCAEPVRKSWSMSVNSSRRVPKHTKQHTQTHLLAPSDRVCRSSRPACGSFLDVSSQSHKISNWHMSFTDQKNSESKLREAFCASNLLQSNVSTSDSVTKPRAPNTIAQTNTTRPSTLASKEHVGSVCVWVEKPLHDMRKRRRKIKAVHTRRKLYTC